MARSSYPDLSEHVAIVTAANHGIGAATAHALADDGAAVLVTALRLAVTGEPRQPAVYSEHRARGLEAVTDAIRASGGRVVALEADLADRATPARLFDQAEAELGPVDILVNNASGWVQDTFGPGTQDDHGRPMAAVAADSIDQNFLVDARAAALLISEFAARHRARSGRWGRIIGLTSGDSNGFPTEVSYGAAKAAQENYTMSAATELAADGITANMVYRPVTDTGWVTDAVREFVATSAEHVHIADPHEVAEVIRWLCSDEARLVSGNVIRLY